MSSAAARPTLPGLRLLAWLVPWAIAVWMVNPFRDIAKDDDWAYALTVQHLLDHHEYRLHDWSTANPTAQIFWGAGFSSLFGFSFATLRFSTLTLLAAALAGLWWLLASEGLSTRDAGVLITVLYSSPLVFLFGLSFMTDVPFLAWLVLGLVCYLRGLRADSWPWMLLASMFASLSILTRQFGVALPLALVLVLLVQRSRGRIWLAGLAMPLCAVAFQIWSGVVEPTLFMGINLERQAAYLGDFRHWPAEVFWRFSRICQYVGLYALPLMPVLLHAAWRNRPPWPWVVLLSGAASLDLVLNGTVMPSLPGNLSAALARVPSLRLPLTVASTLTAILLGGFLLRRASNWRAASAGVQLVALLATGLLALHIAYVDLIDEYLIAFLPLTILAVAHAFGRTPKGVKWATAVLSLGALVASTVWTFLLFERKTAFWKAAEALHQRGIPAETIYAGEWTYFHLKGFDELTTDFSPERIARSTYLVWDPLFAPYQVDEKTWVRIGEESYRWLDRSTRHVSVYRRIAAPVGLAPEVRKPR